MKKITFLFFLLTVSLGYSQVVLEDFDGTPPSFTTNNGLGSTAIVADPDNASNMVGQLISAASGDPWQQADLLMQNNLMDLTSDTTVQVDVYSNTAINVLSRIEDPILMVAPFATADANHTGSGWETLTFDFTELPDGGTAANNEFSQISFFPNWVGGGAGNNMDNNNWNNPVDGITLLVDNITAVAGTSLPIETCNDGIMNQDETGIDCGGSTCPACPSAPTTGAPTPPNRDPADVISFFSDAYSDITVDTFDTPWCGNTTTEVMVDGNPTKLTTGAACEGVDWQSSRPVDASSMTHFHMDFYTDEADLVGKVFNLKFSQWSDDDPGNDPDNGERSALELAINTGTSPAIVTGSWVSIDVEIDVAFFNNLRRDDIVQFVITTNLQNVWYDNLYLHNNTVLSTNEFETAELKVFPNPTNGDWNLLSANTINDVLVYDILGKQVITMSPDSNEATIDGSSLRTGVYFARIEGVNGSQTIKLVKE
ncbi:MAG: T9SS type A sorting domain-containing protein [Bacteroidota bacterium]